MNNFGTDVGFGHLKTCFRDAGGALIDASCPAIAVLKPKGWLPLDAMGAQASIARVEIDDEMYVVGHDAPRFLARGMPERTSSSRWVLSPQYRALSALALAQQPHDTVHQWVVGLPVSTYRSHAARLERELIGTHWVPNLQAAHRPQSRPVMVKSAIALMQPHAAYLSATEAQPALLDEQYVVVIDVGFETVDAVAFAHGVPDPGVEACIHGGMAAALRDIASALHLDGVRAVGPDAASWRPSTHEVETALRNGTDLYLQGYALPVKRKRGPRAPLTV